MRDILPSFLISLAMLGCVLAVPLLGLPDILTLIVQVAVGVVVYVLLSALFRLSPFQLLLGQIKKFLQKRK